MLRRTFSTYGIAELHAIDEYLYCDTREPTDDELEPFDILIRQVVPQHFTNAESSLRWNRLMKRFSDLTDAGYFRLPLELRRVGVVPPTRPVSPVDP
jgi:hypothetical protein